MTIYKPCLYPGCPVLVRCGYCEKHRMRKRFCAHGGCPEVVQGKAFCDKHDPALNRDPEKRREAWRKNDLKRGTASDRGYDKAWSRLSKAYLGKHPLCEDCESRGVLTPAVLVHHIIPLREGGARLDANNLAALCRKCHEEAHRCKSKHSCRKKKEEPGGFL